MGGVLYQNVEERPQQLKLVDRFIVNQIALLNVYIYSITV